MAIFDAHQQARAGSAAEWTQTSRTNPRAESGLLRELRVSTYMVLGMIAVVALAVLLG